MGDCRSARHWRIGVGLTIVRMMNQLLTNDIWQLCARGVPRLFAEREGGSGGRAWAEPAWLLIVFLRFSGLARKAKIYKNKSCTATGVSEAAELKEWPLSRGYEK